MKKTFVVNEKTIEITETTAIYGEEELETLLLHDEDDEFRNGDCITADYAEFPETDEEAETLVNNAYWTTYWHKNEDGIIICDE